MVKSSTLTSFSTVSELILATMTEPAVPATTSVPDKGQRATFFTANRGSSEYGSNVPTCQMYQ